MCTGGRRGEDHAWPLTGHPGVGASERLSSRRSPERQLCRASAAVHDIRNYLSIFFKPCELGNLSGIRLFFRKIIQNIVIFFMEICCHHERVLSPHPPGPLPLFKGVFSETLLMATNGAWRKMLYPRHEHTYMITVQKCNIVHSRLFLLNGSDWPILLDINKILRQERVSILYVFYLTRCAS